MSRFLRLPDGTTWPHPTTETEDDYGLAWTLTYGTPNRADLLLAASTVRAYGYLLTATTRQQRDQIVRDVRLALTEEAR